MTFDNNFSFLGNCIKTMALSRESFSSKTLPDLLLNIHYYTHKVPRVPETLQYAKWCVEIAAEQWLPEYLNFTFVMESILYKDKGFYDFDELLPCDKHLSYDIIRK